jgi:hypothetical protein
MRVKWQILNLPNLSIFLNLNRKPVITKRLMSELLDFHQVQRYHHQAEHLRKTQCFVPVWCALLKPFCKLLAKLARHKSKMLKGRSRIHVMVLLNRFHGATSSFVANANSNTYNQLDV